MYYLPVAMEEEHVGIDFVILEGSSDDTAAVSAVHDAAFGTDAEGRLVDRLRHDGLIVASVVGMADRKIVANAVFSKILLTTPSATIPAVALAPVAVMPAYQRRGLGTAVIRYGLRLCAERGYEAAFVLGDHAYYARFGFSSELGAHVSSPYSNAGSAWMALNLVDSSAPWLQAKAHYPDAFSIVD